MAVLTEELGHHLDGLLNVVDTPGDEGEYFANLVMGTKSNAQSDSREPRKIKKTVDLGMISAIIG
jgi:hypothetical protein